MKKLLLLLVAFSILNQSIDIDYSMDGWLANYSYDDIDSVYELVIENFTGDPGYTGEDDNDEGDPKNSHSQNDISCWLYFQEIKTNPNIASVNSTTIVGLYNSFMISKGYCMVVSPPPDLAFSS
jgi:hypothetical protein